MMFSWLGRIYDVSEMFCGSVVLVCVVSSSPRGECDVAVMFSETGTSCCVTGMFSSPVRALWDIAFSIRGRITEEVFTPDPDTAPSVTRRGADCLNVGAINLASALIGVESGAKVESNPPERGITRAVLAFTGVFSAVPPPWPITVGEGGEAIRLVSIGMSMVAGRLGVAGVPAGVGRVLARAMRR